MMNLKGAGVVFVDGIYVGLGLRSPNVPAPNHWGSIGGKCEKDETPVQTAVRETLEETHIVLDPNLLIFFNEFVESNGFVYSTFLYPCDKEDILNQFHATDEIVDLQFVPVGRLPEPTLLSQEFIGNLRSHMVNLSCATVQKLRGG